MCLATVYVEKGDQREEVMREVAWITVEGSELQLVTLMRDSKRLEARIKSIDLMNSSVLCESAPAHPSRPTAHRKGDNDV